ncbi:phage major capsid protein [Streptomyces sp. WMMC897]|uniref:phage major capsid protein n=2 Tax=Streptomyces sp. WMMC897 TaxID=3014782 RepID=UPI0022B6DD3E|nr:phage major capsid protein [Streptomyces sp. WMMC897]MCZ7413073.1 phage major capsid protein [Streptomyces sp. WMMC897]MCZ7415455.1 phage major capsid protein [Streptomyces sp. WMMC897]
MSEVAKQLQQRRQNVWEQAKALADKAAEENRTFSGEEEASWTAMNSELDALDRRIKAVIEGEQRAKDAEDAMSRLRGEPRGKEQPKGGPGTGGGEELRAFLRGEGPRAFDVRPDGPVSFRDLSKATSGAGGATVPTSFYDRLVSHMIETSSILQAGATVLNTASGEVLQVPKTTAHSSAGIVSEAATISESDPAFGQVALGAYKYGTMIQISRELLTDTGVDLEGYLSMQAGRALGNAFGAHAISGDGSGKPRGILTDATAGATGPTGVTGGFGSQSTAGQGADLLIELFHSVIAPYRASSSCRWIMNDGTAGTIRKIKTTEGQYIWQPSVIAGTPDTILGKPVLTDPNVPDVALSAESVIFGDMSQYFVRLAGGVRFERSDEFAFNSDLVTFRALMRADSALVDLTGAVKTFTGGAS